MLHSFDAETLWWPQFTLWAPQCIPHTSNALCRSRNIKRPICPLIISRRVFLGGGYFIFFFPVRDTESRDEKETNERGRLLSSICAFNFLSEFITDRSYYGTSAAVESQELLDRSLQKFLSSPEAIRWLFFKKIYLKKGVRLVTVWGGGFLHEWQKQNGKRWITKVGCNCKKWTCNQTTDDDIDVRASQEHYQLAVCCWDRIAGSFKGK